MVHNVSSFLLPAWVILLLLFGSTYGTTDGRQGRALLYDTACSQACSDGLSTCADFCTQCGAVGGDYDLCGCADCEPSYNDCKDGCVVQATPSPTIPSTDEPTPPPPTSPTPAPSLDLAEATDAPGSSGGSSPSSVNSGSAGGGTATMSGHVLAGLVGVLALVV